MAMTKKSKIENFIDGAPEGARKKASKGQKQQITVVFDKEMLQALDELAAGEGVARNGLIRVAVKNLLAKGTTIGGE